MTKISTSGIAPQQQIKSEHLLRIINALSGDVPNTTIEVSGSITASYFVGDGSQLTNLPIPSGSSGSFNPLEIYTESGTFLGGDAKARIGDINLSMHDGSGIEYSQNTDVSIFSPQILLTSNLINGIFISGSQCLIGDYEDKVNGPLLSVRNDSSNNDILLTSPNGIKISKDGNTYINLETSLLTQNRTLLAPDKSGTIALLDDVGIPTGLEAINEGNGIGWRLIGRDSASFGNIGDGAVDLGQSSTPSSTFGATGGMAFSVGVDNTAAGYGAVTLGYLNNISSNSTLSNTLGYGNTITSGYTSIALGYGNTISAPYTNAFGVSNTVSRFYGNALGIGLIHRSVGGLAVGVGNTDYTQSGLNSDDGRLFIVGNGTLIAGSPNTVSSRSDAFIVKHSGELLAPSLTTTLINNDSTGKILINKEYLNNNVNPLLDVYSESGTIGDGDAEAYIGDFNMSNPTGSGFFYNQDIGGGISNIGMTGDLVMVGDAVSQTGFFKKPDGVVVSSLNMSLDTAPALHLNPLGTNTSLIGDTILIGGELGATTPSTSTGIITNNFGVRSPLIGLGDVAASGNGTLISLNDTSETVTINATNTFINGYKLPSSDGTNGQIFKTDGSGSVTWEDNSYEPIETVNTGTVISLTTSGGNLCNFGSANANTTYTTTGTVLNAYAKVLINTTSEPTITGATKIAGATWVTGTDMYMVVNYTGAARGVEYYFLEI